MLWISIDTLRADHLGCYGYFRDTSPHLDELAAASQQFMHAYTPIATTLPSHTTMFTGVYPIEHGILSNARYGGRTYGWRPGLATLPEALQGIG